MGENPNFNIHVAPKLWLYKMKAIVKLKKYMYIYRQNMNVKHKEKTVLMMTI